MAAPVPKTKRIEQLVKLVQKRTKGIVPPQERPVLEGLIYAALLENASQSQADEAYTVFDNYFVDWNEARVALPQELADIFPMLPEPLQAGERVRGTLQAVFERTFQFDLEDIPKKSRNLSQAVEFFEKLPGCSRFMADVMTQTVLGGHTIPLDEATLRVFRLLGLTQVNDSKTKEFVPGIERAISKKKGITIFYQLHHFAATYFNDPEAAELRQILKPLDAEVLTRSCAKPVLVIPKNKEKPRYVPAVKLPPERITMLGGDDDEFDEAGIGTERISLGNDADTFPPKQGAGEKSKRGRKPKHLTEESKSGKKKEEPKNKKAEPKPAKEKKSVKKEAKKGRPASVPKKPEKKSKPSASSQKSTKKNPAKTDKKKKK